MRTSRRQLFSLAAVAPAALLLSGCSLGDDDDEPISDRTIDGVATTGMVGDLVANVARDRVDLTVLMGPGIDPHLFRASERTTQTMESADIIFYNGLFLEGGLDAVLQEMGEHGRTVAVAEALPAEQLLPSADYEGQPDPHIWFDVSLWNQACGAVIEALAEFDPDSAEAYRANGEAYQAELAALETWVFDQVATVPEAQRVLVTAHDAFGYFGARYGFEVRGIQGASTATEASAGDVQELAEFIAERQIPAIFVESSVPQRTIEALREAVQSRGFDVSIGGQLFSDAMGDPGTEEGTYLGMIRWNITTIVSALTGGGAGA